MDSPTSMRSSGSYTANLLGNIKTHLAGLQGYDVMALELIQNADDAKAEEIGFDITDRGLLVRNSGQFTYCGDLQSPCGFGATTGHTCDYHRIADVGSGGKLTEGENIGRFGIGFVSTYQITDHPEIRSAGIKLTLHPEAGKWFIDPFDEPTGTSFFLPWATDPTTRARLGLGVSPVTRDHIDQLALDFQSVLRRSLLFLRHVRKAEVRRNGALLLACDLVRGEGSSLSVTFRPGGKSERWHILRADAADAAKPVYATHPRLERLRRSTKISIGLRLAPEPIEDGLLYAFLPTEQSTGLPLHVNADFFPEPDRKAVIFAGHQHEQAWNEMLIDAAATELARDLESLRELVGDDPLWLMLDRAHRLSTASSGHPPCFNRFWERLRGAAGQARIALAHDKSMRRPAEVFLPQAALTPQQEAVLLEVKGMVVAEILRRYRTTMNELGAPILTLERLVSLLEGAMAQQGAGTTRVDDHKLTAFYRPLWSLVNDLLPAHGTLPTFANPAVVRLRNVPLLVTEGMAVVTLEEAYRPPERMDPSRAAAALPRLAMAAHGILEYPRIVSLIRVLDLGAVAGHIDSMCADGSSEDVVGVDPDKLRGLYSLFAELDAHKGAEESVYDTLRDLPIWLSSRGLIRATRALLPGDFTDPTGQADLLETAVLTESARSFLAKRLGVQTQTVEAFVEKVLPTFFTDAGPQDETKYPELITELADHPALMNDPSITKLLGSLPMVPTQDGKWSRPTSTYRRTDKLVKVLGDARDLWLDESRVPKARSVDRFIDSLGIRRHPSARHLVARMCSIAKQYPPSPDARRNSAEAFYALCDKYDDWKDKPSFQKVIGDLRQARCFPVEDDTMEWHTPWSLHAPYRAEAFRSQAKILDFKNMTRLKTGLLENLRVCTSPDTSLVIAHLRHCMDTRMQPHATTYQILNERAQQEAPLLRSLIGSECIYVDGPQTFVRPNQVYWTPQQLGRFAFTIPAALESYKPLFTALGVKHGPEGGDFVDILLDIVEEYFGKGTPLSGNDRAVYDACLAGASRADEHQELTSEDLRRLHEAPSIPNLDGYPTYPDEVLFRDSEWHAAFFAGELDRALTRPDPEIWPFVEKLGVKRLSQSARVELDLVEGQEASERELADELKERADLLVRLLHDKATTLRQRIRPALAEIEAISYDVVRIRASVWLGGHEACAPPTSVQAYYDAEKRHMMLSRPIDARTRLHLLTALFHQLMPEEPGSEISKLTLAVRPLFGMPVDEAHRELTAAGIPSLDGDLDRVDHGDLTSNHLGEIGAASEFVEQDRPLAELGPAGGAVAGRGDRAPGREGDEQPAGGHRPGERPASGGDATSASDSSRRAGVAERKGPAVGAPEGGDSLPEERSGWRPRAKHKERWDRKLLSYVHRKIENQEQPKTDGSSFEHALGIEVKARAAVCGYEKARGRIPEQMAHTHPGYDIVSRDPVTGEVRFIEVKGVQGKWSATGVGLSMFQFSNAQERGTRYWMYVVEFVGDPAAMAIHAIQDPASKVSTFMFDGNWRAVATTERARPEMPFIPGARIDHQYWGPGRISRVTLRGRSRELFVEFGKGGGRTVTADPAKMRLIVDEPDGDGS